MSFNILNFYLILLITIATNVLCDKRMDAEQLSRSCLKEAKVTESELTDFYTNGMVFNSNPKENVKCHMKCMMERQGHMQNGKFNEESAIRGLRDVPELRDHLSEVEHAVRDCKNEHGTTDCDTAYKINLCMKEYKSSMKK